MHKSSDPINKYRQRYSLAHLSALPLPPHELIDLAIATGYDLVGVRLLPPAPGIAFYPIMDDASQLKEVMARLADHPNIVWDVEVIRLTPNFKVDALEPAIACAQKIGARAVLVSAGPVEDPMELAQYFSDFCELAANWGLTANVEFMPWTPVPDLTAALALIKNAGSPANARVLADTIHVERSRTTLRDWAAVPETLIDYVQFCDAPAGVPETMDEILRQARYERLLPGEGGIDLLGFLRHLPVGRPIAVECWHQIRTPAVGFEAWARQALQATQNIVNTLSH